MIVFLKWVTTAEAVDCILASFRSVYLDIFLSTEKIVEAFDLLESNKNMFPNGDMFAVNGRYACSQCMVTLCWY